MWQLKQVSAKSLCSFEEFDYSPTQEQATLIFGNNMDSDSQNSNGSGKSALIEAIAIGITGEPLRKVNNDEIINDRFDEASVRIVLSNAALESQLTIDRRLSRKNPQEVIVTEQTGPYDTDTEEIKQASVSDYNKYILDRLGLTKDDILSNFILTARKYKSFLSSSDKDKKEIINRFSNGILVDESIEALKADMEPIQKRLTEAERNVAACTGRVEALAAEIEKAINESAERKATTQSRIDNWKRLIAEKREAIRTNNKNIEEIDSSLDALDVLDEDMQKLEKSKTETTDALKEILEAFKANNLALTTDYEHEIRCLLSTVETAGKEIKHISQLTEENRLNLDAATEEHKELKAKWESDIAATEADKAKCDAKIKELTQAVRDLQAKNRELEVKRRELNQAAANLEKQLAGVIECPKCHHEFTYKLTLDIEAARTELAKVKEDIKKVAATVENNDAKYDASVAEGKQYREQQTALANKVYEIEDTISRSSRALEAIRQDYIKYSSQVASAQYRLNQAEMDYRHIRKRLFDDVFETLDAAYKSRETRIKSLEESNETLKGSISSYQKAIEDAQNATEENLLGNLKQSQAKYQADLTTAIKDKEEVEAELNEYKIQEATFVEFKTYLANTKINAISQITNSFLEAIGSDIRVALSGYTILKSGKVRDKISVSLLRDGVDCGSFDKFSAGERCRVELASVLAMHQLLNSNCDELKGLDLLVLDEVMDSTDEDGLASMFKALNNLQLTALIISHGGVAENYPNRLIVNKKDGVSYL